MQYSPLFILKLSLATGVYIYTSPYGAWLTAVPHTMRIGGKLRGCAPKSIMR